METKMTKNGYEKLIERKKELLEKIDNMLFRMGEASEQGGGWHENNFFEHAEEQMHHLRGLLADVNNQIRNAKIVQDVLENNEFIDFGSTVEVEINDEKETYKILGEADIDLAKGIISINSPLGKSLIGKKEGEEFEGELPFGKIKIKIIKIR